MFRQAVLAGCGMWANELILITLLWLSPFKQAAPTGQVLEHAVTFRIKNAGLTVNGSFSDLKASVRFDPDHLTDSQLSASVGVASIRTGLFPRDSHLQSKAYFDAETYPRMLMQSTRIRRVNETSFMGTFNLTIRGVTRAIDVPFTYTQADGRGTFTGQFTINRLDFGVGNKSWLLSEEVRVTIQLITSLTT